MSPRRLDPNARTEIIEIAAGLLAQEGPQALTTRRIAAEMDTSTMVVYTHFGSMGELVRAMVHEGFARLQHYFTRVRSTDDPVADMALLGRAYRHNAFDNSHLFAVMFGGSSPAGFSLTEDDRQYGRYTLGNIVQCARRCIEAGRFRPGDAELVARHMWSATHGLIILELGGYLASPYDAESCFETHLASLMTGAGDTHSAATASVMASRKRFAQEVVSTTPEDRAPGVREKTGGGRRRTRPTASAG